MGQISLAFLMLGTAVLSLFLLTLNDSGTEGEEAKEVEASLYRDQCSVFLAGCPLEYKTHVK